MRLSADEVISGRYRLERLVGEGGMGMVWSAIDQKTSERVALKCLKDDGKKNELLVRRFAREARAAMAVAHPNVVKIRDIITTEEREPLIVMDFLEGESLAVRIARVRRLPLAEFAEIFVGVVSAIGTAHAAGIVHRDLKPDNIFLVRMPDGKEEARVVDFGIAKLTALEGEAKQTGGLTTTGAVLGTPYYMSPEQVFGDKNIDHRSDIWSLGLIIFECLAGFRAVEGENIGQLLKVITTGAIPRLRDAVPSLPEDVLELTERMVSPDRTKRPHDLREVLNVFRRHATREAASFGEATIPDDIQHIRDIHPMLARAGDVSPTAETLSAPPMIDVNRAPSSTTGGAAISQPQHSDVPPKKPRSAMARVVAIGTVVCAISGIGFVSYRAASNGFVPAGGQPVSPAQMQANPGAPGPPGVQATVQPPIPEPAPLPIAPTAASVKAPTPTVKKIGAPAPAQPKASASATTTTTAAPAAPTTTSLQGAVGQDNPYAK